MVFNLDFQVFQKIYRKILFFTLSNMKNTQKICMFSMHTTTFNNTFYKIVLTPQWGRHRLHTFFNGTIPVALNTIEGKKSKIQTGKEERNQSITVFNSWEIKHMKFIF